MNILSFVLLLIGALCFTAAAVNVSAKVNLLAVGLLAWILVPLITAGQALH